MIFHRWISFELSGLVDFPLKSTFDLCFKRKLFGFLCVGDLQKIKREEKKISFDDFSCDFWFSCSRPKEEKNKF